jgi:putative YhdH/YhfP family quinone oxidoreductase
MAKQFRAYRVEESGDGKFERHLRTLSVDDLPAGEVLVRVHWSSLNYKDALSATGNKGVTRNFPHTPGIDAAGVVEQSSDDTWKPGDEVIVTSYDLGMNTPGGLGEYIRVPSAWLVRKPALLGLRDSMILGTAGFTAALCVQALMDRRVFPEQGDVLVTGASGGVGCLAVALLARLGYRAVAVTGKAEAESWLRELGAAEVIGRDEVRDDSGRPLLKTRWAGAVDTCGGDMLEGVLKTLHYGGAVACCGLVASPELHTTVMPFILRGVSLLGVDSQNTPMEQRQGVWDRLADDWRPQRLESVGHEITLEGVDEAIAQLLAGGVRGRYVVNMNGAR